MAKRRWIYINGEAIEITDGYVPPESHDAKNFVVGDRHYDGLRSPKDGADISTRVKHREYMIRHGLTTTDDYKGEWANAAKKRADFFAGKDPSRGRDIARAVEMVNQGHKPRRYQGD